MAGIALGPLWLQAPFANRPMERIAELSYAVYLIHLPVAVWVGLVWLDLPRDGTPLTVLAWFGAVFTVSFAYAAVSRRLVERPALRWSRRYAPPGGAPIATPLGARPAGPP
jgi:peptidoglycan/LPS O-acetylase OafA/YrhL